MRRSLIALLMVATIAACNDGEGVAATYIHAQVGGKYWSAPASEGGLVYPGGAPDGAGFIYIVAARAVAGGSEFLSLDLPSPPLVGSYPLDDVAASAMFATCPDQDFANCTNWKPVAARAGTLTITRVDAATGLIEGTFSFTGYIFGDTTGVAKNVSQGQFSIITPAIFTSE